MRNELKYWYRSGIFAEIVTNIQSCSKSELVSQYTSVFMHMSTWVSNSHAKLYILSLSKILRHFGMQWLVKMLDWVGIRNIWARQTDYKHGHKKQDVKTAHMQRYLELQFSNWLPFGKRQNAGTCSDSKQLLTVKSKIAQIQTLWYTLRHENHRNTTCPAIKCATKLFYAHKQTSPKVIADAKTMVH